MTRVGRPMPFLRLRSLLLSLGLVGSCGLVGCCESIPPFHCLCSRLVMHKCALYETQRSGASRNVRSHIGEYLLLRFLTKLKKYFHLLFLDLLIKASVASTSLAFVYYILSEPLWVVLCFTSAVSSLQVSPFHSSIILSALPPFAFPSILCTTATHSPCSPKAAA